MGTGNGNGELGGCKTGNQGGDNREYIKEAQITFMYTDNASTAC